MYSYTVKGSEDGVIGVFTSKKAALQCAKQYCLAFDSAAVKTTVDTKAYVSMSSEQFSAEVERYHTNYNPLSQKGIYYEKYQNAQ